MSSDTSRLPALSSKRPSLDAGRALGAARGLVASGRWAEVGLIAVLAVSLLLVRAKLFPWQTDDYTRFLVHWYAYLQQHGFSGLGDEFANYNVPYLYLLWVGTLLHVDALTWVKVLGTVSDLAMAGGCVALLRQLSAPRGLAWAGGAAVLLLPEVLLNSAAWGQADSTYTTFIVWGLWAMLRNRGSAAWALLGAAFSFKLQAAFILPAFAVVHLTRRWRWWTPLAAVAVVLALEIPALVAGRSPASLAAIYLDQAAKPATLTMNAPSLYALLPESQHDVIRNAGMYLAVACVALLSVVVLAAARRRALADRTIVLFVASLALLAPYTLPTMHERYFYVGNVLLLVLALLDRRLLPWALAAQAIAVLAYTPFLFGTTPVIPMAGLALGVAALLFVVIRDLLQRTDAFPPVAPA